MVLILGAGLTGLSASYHIGHESCLILEKNNYVGGHIYSDIVKGFTWDEGPHLSFTNNEYVKNLFAESLDGDFLEYPVKTTNYYKGTWIPHPAQSNLYALPSPLKENCLKDFLDIRKNGDNNFKPNNYEEWLEYAFGKTFATNFPYSYTKNTGRYLQKNLILIG